MQPTIVEGYLFEELSKKAQREAMSIFYGWHADDCDTEHEMILDPWREKLDELGYWNVEINYSGFFSQGCGASFTAAVDVCQWLKKQGLYHELRLLYNFAKAGGVMAHVKHSGRDFHEGSIYVEVDLDEPNPFCLSWYWRLAENPDGDFIDGRWGNDSFDSRWDKIGYNEPEPTTKLDRIRYQARELAGLIHDHAVRLSKQIYRELEEAELELTSDETLLERFNTPPRLFTARGEIL